MPDKGDYKIHVSPLSDIEKDIFNPYQYQVAQQGFYSIKPLSTNQLFI